MNAAMQWISKGMFLTVIVAAAGCAGMREQERLAERELLKREIMEELRAEFARSNSVPPPPQPSTAAVDNDSPSALPIITSTPASTQPGSVGAAKGQLLAGKQGMPFILVRLVRMDAFHSLRSADYRADDYYDTKTDRDGRYCFSFVEPGKYKLLWVPPSADYWVRRLADKPDVVVEAGRIAVVRPLETKGRLVGD